MADLRRQQRDVLLHLVAPERPQLAELRRQQVDAVLHALDLERPPSTAPSPPAARADDAPRRAAITRSARGRPRGRTLHPVEIRMAPERDPTAGWRRWQQAVMTLQIRTYPASAVEAGAPPGAEPGAPPLTRRALEAQLATRERQLADREQRIADLTVAVTRERETRQRDVRLLELMLSALREEVSYLHRQPPPFSPPASLPPALLKQLRSLCHPDRWHGLPQEQTALEVMQWLNRLPSRP